MPLMKIFACSYSFFSRSTAPMMNLLDLRHSAVVRAGIQSGHQGDTRTSGSRAKLPLEPKLVSGLLLACAVVAYYFSSTGLVTADADEKSASSAT